MLAIGRPTGRKKGGGKGGAKGAGAGTDDGKLFARLLKISACLMGNGQAMQRGGFPRPAGSTALQHSDPGRHCSRPDPNTAYRQGRQTPPNWGRRPPARETPPPADRKQDQSGAAPGGEFPHLPPHSPHQAFQEGQNQTHRVQRFVLWAVVKVVRRALWPFPPHSPPRAQTGHRAHRSTGQWQQRISP